VTPGGANNLAEVMATGWFVAEMDVYRVSIAVAIAQGLCTATEEMAGVKTKWNVGSIDNDGRMRQMVTAIVREAGERPYEYSERLADAGLAVLAQRLGREGALLSEVVSSSVRHDRPSKETSSLV
jgi:hypothetical protein